MHIQNGGRYQHVLTYSSHNNALRITYQRANLLWHCFDGKTPWYCFENNWFVIPGQPGEGEGKALRYEKDVPNAIIIYVWVMINVWNDFLEPGPQQKADYRRKPSGQP